MICCCDGSGRFVDYQRHSLLHLPGVYLWSAIAIRILARKCMIYGSACLWLSKSFIISSIYQSIWIRRFRRFLHYFCDTCARLDLCRHIAWWFLTSDLEVLSSQVHISYRMLLIVGFPMWVDRRSPFRTLCYKKLGWFMLRLLDAPHLLSFQDLPGIYQSPWRRGFSE